MAQAQDAVVGQKRGPGRPPKNAQSPPKRVKISSPLLSPTVPASTELSPVVQPSLPEKRAHRLPVRLYENRPLPTLSEQQSVTLSNDDYQSIPASAVLKTSLARSRQKWVCEGIFERYWVKPEAGKNARPPPPNNPEVKWQVGLGQCRIRIEPHIFEVEAYVEEKPVAKVTQVKQYIPPVSQSAYGQPYRQNQQQVQHHQPLPPPGVRATAGTQSTSPQPTIRGGGTHTNPQQPLLPQGQRPSSKPANPPIHEKRPSADPVISRLANRASSDSNLKTLMKEVANGGATEAQLKVFQGHIDELTREVNEEKARQQRELAATAAKPVYTKPVTADATKYEKPPDQLPAQQRTPTTWQQSAHTPTSSISVPQSKAWQPTPSTVLPPPQPVPVQAPPADSPVIIAFTGPGASEDRFLFPRYSILEILSPNHLVASFMVTRKGRDAADAAGLGADVEYWQPVTLMVEAAYEKERILDLIKKWVKPADEVKAYMKEVMQRATKAPDAYLALRLPVNVKGNGVVEVDEMVSLDDEKSTPAATQEKTKKGPNVKFVKKTFSTKPAISPSGQAETATLLKTNPAEGQKQSIPAEAGAALVKAEIITASDDTSLVETDAANDTGRPRRTIRKSVRISDV